MDYIRICRDVSHTSNNVSHTSNEISSNDIKDLLKDWIKLYPNSFAPDVDFKIFQLENGDFIIQLHEDLSSMAVSLLVLYFENVSRQVAKSPSHQELFAEPEFNSQSSIVKVQQSKFNRQQTSSMAYITIDDTEVLLKQNEGKRAMVFLSHRVTESLSQQEAVDESEFNSQSSTVKVQQTTDNGQQSSSTYVRFILEDNYVLDYNFEKRAKPVKDSGLVFNEEEFNLPEEFETVRVGDVVKKNIDKVLEEEGLTPKKMLIYFLCGTIGLSIGFLIVYFMGR